jgi:hypothetical protein
MVCESLAAARLAATGESMNLQRSFKAGVVILLGAMGFGATTVKPAAAATLYTPVLAANAASLYCEATNVSPKPRTISVELENYFDGTSLGSNSGTVQPGHTLEIATSNVPGFCKVTVSGSKSTVRAVLWVLSGFNTIAAASAE